MKAKSTKPVAQKTVRKKSAGKKPVKAGKSMLAAPDLLGDVRGMILSGRQFVASTVNSAMLQLYWRIGQRIRADVLAESRADYGQSIVVTLSQQLQPEFGQGFSRSNLSRMVSLAEAFPEEGPAAQTTAGKQTQRSDPDGARGSAERRGCPRLTDVPIKENITLDDRNIYGCGYLL